MYLSLNTYLIVRTFLLAILLFIITSRIEGQTNAYTYAKIAVEITKQKRPKMISTKVGIISPFPGGDSAWVRSLEEKLNKAISYRNGTPRGKYTVYVQFIVSQDGTLSDVRSLTSNGYGMDAEVVRALKKGTSWAPASSNGRKVNEYRH